MKPYAWVIVATAFLTAPAYAGDPNMGSGKNRGSTEAGLSSSKSSSQVGRYADTSGTIKDNHGNTRNYKDGRIVSPAPKSSRPRNQ